MRVDDQRVRVFLNRDTLGRLRENPDGYLQHYAFAAAPIAGIGRGQRFSVKCAASAACLWRISGEKRLRLPKTPYLRQRGLGRPTGHEPMSDSSPIY